MKTQGEVEAEISKGVNQIYAGLLGRGAKDIKTNVIGASVLVILQNTLTVTQVQIAGTTDGRRIIKEMCEAIVNNTRTQFQTAVTQATGQNIVDMHHDISVNTGREIFVFSLAASPTYRIPNGK